MNPHVLGLDLSLTATGVALVGDRDLAGGRTWSTETLKPPNLTGLDRIEWIHGQIGAYLRTTTVLVVIEGPSYGSTSGAFHERAGLWWIVLRTLVSRVFRVAIAPPASVKKYATGKGNAAKGAMLLATAKRFPDFDGDDNAADALWLAAMGADRLGLPPVVLPSAHRDALKGVAWPAGVAALDQAEKETTK